MWVLPSVRATPTFNQAVQLVGDDQLLEIDKVGDPSSMVVINDDQTFRARWRALQEVFPAATKVKSGGNFIGNFKRDFLNVASVKSFVGGLAPMAVEGRELTESGHCAQQLLR